MTSVGIHSQPELAGYSPNAGPIGRTEYHGSREAESVGSVVVTTSQYSDLVVVDLVNKSMFPINAPGPTAFQVALSSILFHPPGEVLKSCNVKLQASQ